MKLPSIPLFTDTFTAETVHLSNEQVGIYIRLLCFAWTKNAKAFTTQSANRICQCKTIECEGVVLEVLDEFFIRGDNRNTWTHGRITKEYEYLQKYYVNKSESGKRGASKRWNRGTLEKEKENQNALVEVLANGESMAPIPSPIPIPKNNNNNFDIFWESLSNKRGSKKMAKIKYEKECKDQDPEQLAKIFNYYSGKIKDKTFIPHVATWINQRRFEDEDVKPDPRKAPFTPQMPDGRVFKVIGDFGNYFQILLDGEKWYKHKFKNDEPLKKDI